MNININNRGNGVCPGCRVLPHCEIHATLLRKLEKTPDPTQSGMELVIYDCPKFSEK